jgi:hypothetical protein
MHDFPLFLFLAVGAMALFTFLAVSVFSESRTKERLAYHRHETLKKLAESTEQGAAKVLELMHEEDRLKRRRQLEGLKLGGLIVAGVGLALTLFLYFLDAGQPDGVFIVGFIPLFVGLAMLLYATLLAPSTADPRSGSSQR